MNNPNILDAPDKEGKKSIFGPYHPLLSISIAAVFYTLVTRIVSGIIWSFLGALDMLNVHFMAAYALQFLMTLASLVLLYRMLDKSKLTILLAIVYALLMSLFASGLGWGIFLIFAGLENLPGNGILILLFSVLSIIPMAWGIYSYMKEKSYNKLVWGCAVFVIIQIFRHFSHILF